MMARQSLSFVSSSARFAAPWMTGVMLLYAVPMLVLAVVSCTRWDGRSLSTMQWVGAENFKRLLTDPGLRKAVLNSVTYTAMNVPAQLLAGLILALVIRRSRRVGLWATIYYLPHVLGGVATILVWWWLLNPQIGPINSWLEALHDVVDRAARAVGGSGLGAWSPPPWLYDPGWAKPSLVLMNIWQCGGGMLIILAALMRADPAIEEAALVDGAGRISRFMSITLPQVSPALLFNTLTGVIFSMQSFSEPMLLSNFQQQESLLFYSLYLYQCAFERGQFGYAAAMVWALLGLLIAFTVSVVLLTRRWVQHEMESA